MLSYFFRVLPHAALALNSTVSRRKTGRSCLIGYYSLHNSTRIQSQVCFGILSSLAFEGSYSQSKINFQATISGEPLVGSGGQ